MRVSFVSVLLDDMVSPTGISSLQIDLMSDWADTTRVTGEVIFAVGGSLKGDFHLQVSTATHRTAETPLEMLNRPETFFPLTLSDGDVRLVSKDHVVAVSFGEGAHEPPPLPQTEPVSFEVSMADGSEYQGQVHIELKPPHTRGLDLLNQAERFFALTVPGGTWYLSRSNVRHVRPHE